MIDPTSIWTQHGFDDAGELRIDIRATLAAVDGECVSDVAAHMAEHLAILDEAIQVLLQLYDMLRDVPAAYRDRSTTVSMMCASRAAGCLIGIRRLLLGGLEDIGRIVARSCAETLDVGLLALLDSSFAQLHFDAAGEDGFDENRFWLQHLGRGKLAKRLRAALEAAGAPPARIDDYLASASEGARRHSGAVHSGMKSVFRSAAVPSLANPEMLHLSATGHVSALSPLLAFEVSERCHMSTMTIVGLLVESSSVPALSILNQERERTSGFFAAFFTLQECLALIEPDLVARYGERPV